MEKVPQKYFCSFWKLSTVTAQTISQWNQGSASSGIILNRLFIRDIRVNANHGFRFENGRRLTAAAQKISKKYKKQHQLNRQNRKQKRDEGSCESRAHDLQPKKPKNNKKLTKQEQSPDLFDNTDCQNVCDAKITFCDESNIHVVKHTVIQP